MSMPARRVIAPLPAPGRAPAPTPPGPPRPTVPSRPETGRPAPAGRRRTRRRLHPGFVAFSSIVVLVMVVGLVALNVLLAQAAFQLREVGSTIDGLENRNLVLTQQAARLSSPGRVARWARGQQMVVPGSDEVHFLRVPGSGG